MYRFACCLFAMCAMCLPIQSFACNPALKPILECVNAKTDGTYVAYFGYNNTSSSTITAAVGSYNKFTPSPTNRGQPTSFSSGRKSYVFSVVFNGANLSWLLESGTVIASSSSPRCQTDCSGVVNGTKVVDQCGVCGGDNSTCRDCSGVINGKKVLDQCGVCGGNNSTCKDCAGVIHGSSVLDQCGVCAGNGTSCLDCAGVPFGSSKVDQCGVCAGDNSTCKDCSGTIHGTMVKDECGICGGNNSTCTDCAGVIHGSSVLDQCGVCAGNGTSCLDCAGVPNGSSVLDQCGVCAGDNSTCLDCAGVPNGSSVLDQCGVCAGNGTSCLDCAGVPNGSSVLDQCGVCAGNGTSCLDCAGNVNGSSVYDLCGVCGGDNSICQDCSGVPNGQAKVDACGVCNGDGKSCDCRKVSIKIHRRKLINTALDLHAKSITYYSRARSCDKDFAKQSNAALRASKKSLNKYIEIVHSLQTSVVICGKETCGKIVNKTKIAKLHKILYRIYELARNSNYVYRDACRITVGPGRGDTTATYQKAKKEVDSCPSGKLCE